jgi:hypothetical protein
MKSGSLKTGRKCATVLYGSGCRSQLKDLEESNAGMHLADQTNKNKRVDMFN